MRTPLIISGPVPKGDDHEFYAKAQQLYYLMLKENQLLRDIRIKNILMTVIMNQQVRSY